MKQTATNQLVLAKGIDTEHKVSSNTVCLMCVLCHFAFEQQGAPQLTLTSKVAALGYSSIESMKLKLTCLLHVAAGALIFFF